MSRSRNRSKSPGRSGTSRLERQTSILGSEWRSKDVRNAQQDISAIIKMCKLAKTTFVDDSFPPTPKSLYFNGVHPMRTSRQHESQSKDEKVYQWLRPGEFKEPSRCQLDWTIFRNPKGSDIIQGLLGNCWLLSSLAVLAEKPSFLEQMFPLNEYCPTGVYQVRLCREGTWMLVTVDDMLPCGKNGRLVYSDCRRRQLWVPLVEKACAKLFGCYEALVAGKCLEGLSILTGAPCETINLQKIKYEDDPDHELIWGQMISASQAGHIMAASCGGGHMETDKQQYNDRGLLSRHAYSVLDVRLANSRRLVRLRNPWGRFSWKGAWSDESREMRESGLRDELSGYGNGEGVFWMDYIDFIKFYDSVDLCRLNHDWNLAKTNGALPSVATTLQHMGVLTVFAPTEVVVTVFQKNNRQRNQTRCLDLGVLVIRCNDKTLAPIRHTAHSKRQLKSFVSVSHLYEPGMYLVVPVAFNHYNCDQGMPTKQQVKDCMPAFTMTFHSISIVNVDRFYLGRHTLADSLWMTVHESGQREDIRTGCSVYRVSGGWSGAIVAIENRDPEQYLQIKYDCMESYNVVATRGHLTTFDSVPPLHRQIIVVLSQLEVSGGYQIGTSYNHLQTRDSKLSYYGHPGKSNVPPISEAIAALHSPRPL